MDSGPMLEPLEARVLLSSDWYAGAFGRTEAVLSVETPAPAGYSWQTLSHNGSMTQLRNGNVAAVWYAGPAEGDPATNIYFSERYPNGTWSTPRNISQEGYSDNTVIFQPKKARPRSCAIGRGPTCGART